MQVQQAFVVVGLPSMPQHMWLLQAPSYPHCGGMVLVLRGRARVRYDLYFRILRVISASARYLLDRQLFDGRRSLSFFYWYSFFKSCIILVVLLNFVWAQTFATD